MHKRAANSGFTLIELSIVLVIIGLIIGGILTGQDLINAATIRAQIAQIEKYNTAVRTFQGKYGYLPGDIPNPYATNFGFLAQSGSSGIYHGDGNGILTPYGQTYIGDVTNCSEPLLFWSDLGTAGLIDGSYSATTTSNLPCTGAGATTVTTPSIGNFIPPAKIGQNNYVYVWSGGYNVESPPAYTDNTNYFSVSAVTKLSNDNYFAPAGATMTVNQAYNIDKKVDDSMPQSGSVLAFYLNGSNADCQNGTSFTWAAGGSNMGQASTGNPCTPTTAATNYQTYNCYDNATPGSAAGAGGQAGVNQTYSMSQNSNRPNCGLSFKFQ